MGWVLLGWVGLGGAGLGWAGLRWLGLGQDEDELSDVAAVIQQQQC